MSLPPVASSGPWRIRQADLPAHLVVGRLYRLQCLSSKGRRLLGRAHHFVLAHLPAHPWHYPGRHFNVMAGEGVPCLGNGFRG